MFTHVHTLSALAELFGDAQEWYAAWYEEQVCEQHYYSRLVP